MTFHKQLSKGRWYKLSLIEQMANVGSEVGRAIRWKDRSNSDAELSFKRTLELLDLTLNDPKNKGRLKEVARTREIFSDWYMGDNLYKTNKEDWQDYFLQFAIASRINK